MSFNQAIESLELDISNNNNQVISFECDESLLSQIDLSFYEKPSSIKGSLATLYYKGSGSVFKRNFPLKLKDGSTEIIDLIYNGILLVKGLNDHDRKQSIHLEELHENENYYYIFKIDSILILDESIKVHHDTALEILQTNLLDTLDKDIKFMNININSTNSIQFQLYIKTPRNFEIIKHGGNIMYLYSFHKAVESKFNIYQSMVDQRLDTKSNFLELKIDIDGFQLSRSITRLSIKSSVTNPFEINPSEVGVVFKREISTESFITVKIPLHLFSSFNLHDDKAVLIVFDNVRRIIINIDNSLFEYKDVIIQLEPLFMANWTTSFNRYKLNSSLFRLSFVIEYFKSGDNYSITTDIGKLEVIKQNDHFIVDIAELKIEDLIELFEKRNIYLFIKDESGETISIIQVMLNNIHLYFIILTPHQEIGTYYCDVICFFDRDQAKPIQSHSTTLFYSIPSLKYESSIVLQETVSRNVLRGSDIVQIPSLLNDIYNDIEFKVLSSNSHIQLLVLHGEQELPTPSTRTLPKYFAVKELLTGTNSKIFKYNIFETASRLSILKLDNLYELISYIGVENNYDFIVEIYEDVIFNTGFEQQLKFRSFEKLRIIECSPVGFISPTNQITVLDNKSNNFNIKHPIHSDLIIHSNKSLLFLIPQTFSHQIDYYYELNEESDIFDYQNGQIEIVIPFLLQFSQIFKFTFSLETFFTELHENLLDIQSIIQIPKLRVFLNFNYNYIFIDNMLISISNNFVTNTSSIQFKKLYNTQFYYLTIESVEDLSEFEGILFSRSQKAMSKQQKKKTKQVDKIKTATSHSNDESDYENDPLLNASIKNENSVLELHKSISDYIGFYILDGYDSVTITKGTYKFTSENIIYFKGLSFMKKFIKSQSNVKFSYFINARDLSHDVALVRLDDGYSMVVTESTDPISLLNDVNGIYRSIDNTDRYYYKDWQYLYLITSSKNLQNDISFLLKLIGEVSSIPGLIVRKYEVPHELEHNIEQELRNYGYLKITHLEQFNFDQLRYSQQMDGDFENYNFKFDGEHVIINECAVDVGFHSGTFLLKLKSIANVNVGKTESHFPRSSIRFKHYPTHVTYSDDIFSNVVLEYDDYYDYLMKNVTMVKISTKPQPNFQVIQPITSKEDDTFNILRHITSPYCNYLLIRTKLENESVLNSNALVTQLVHHNNVYGVFKVLLKNDFKNVASNFIYNCQVEDLDTTVSIASGLNYLVSDDDKTLMNHISIATVLCKRAAEQGGIDKCIEIVQNAEPKLKFQARYANDDNFISLNNALTQISTEIAKKTQELTKDPENKDLLNSLKGPKGLINKRNKILEKIKPYSEKETGFLSYFYSAEPSEQVPPKTNAKPSQEQTTPQANDMQVQKEQLEKQQAMNKAQEQKAQKEQPEKQQASINNNQKENTQQIDDMKVQKEQLEKQRVIQENQQINDRRVQNEQITRQISQEVSALKDNLNSLRNQLEKLDKNDINYSKLVEEVKARENKLAGMQEQYKDYLNGSWDLQNIGSWIIDMVKGYGSSAYDLLARLFYNYLKPFGENVVGLVKDAILSTCQTVFSLVVGGVFAGVTNAAINLVTGLFSNMLASLFGITPGTSVPNSSNINISIVFKPVINNITEITNIVGENDLTNHNLLIRETLNILSKCPQVGKLSSQFFTYVNSLKDNISAEELLEISALTRTFYAHYKKTQSHNIFLPIFLFSENGVIEDTLVSDWIVLLQNDEKIFKSNDFIINGYKIGDDDQITQFTNNNNNLVDPSTSSYKKLYAKGLPYYYRIIAAMRRLYTFTNRKPIAVDIMPKREEYRIYELLSKSAKSEFNTVFKRITSNVNQRCSGLFVESISLYNAEVSTKIRFGSLPSLLGMFWRKIYGEPIENIKNKGILFKIMVDSLNYRENYTYFLKDKSKIAIFQNDIKAIVNDYDILIKELEEFIYSGQVLLLMDNEPKEFKINLFKRCLQLTDRLIQMHILMGTKSIFQSQWENIRKSITSWFSGGLEKTVDYLIDTMEFKNTDGDSMSKTLDIIAGNVIMLIGIIQDLFIDPDNKDSNIIDLDIDDSNPDFELIVNIATAYKLIHFISLRKLVINGLKETDLLQLITNKNDNSPVFSKILQPLTYLCLSWLEISIRTIFKNNGFDVDFENLEADLLNLFKKWFGNNDVLDLLLFSNSASSANDPKSDKELTDNEESQIIEKQKLDGKSLFHYLSDEYVKKENNSEHKKLITLLDYYNEVSSVRKVEHDDLKRNRSVFEKLELVFSSYDNVPEYIAIVVDLFLTKIVSHNFHLGNLAGGWLKGTWFGAEVITHSSPLAPATLIVHRIRGSYYEKVPQPRKTMITREDIYKHYKIDFEPIEPVKGYDMMSEGDGGSFYENESEYTDYSEEIEEKRMLNDHAEEYGVHLNEPHSDPNKPYSEGMEPEQQNGPNRLYHFDFSQHDNRNKLSYSEEDELNDIEKEGKHVDKPLNNQEEVTGQPKQEPSVTDSSDGFKLVKTSNNKDGPIIDYELLLSEYKPNRKNEKRKVKGSPPKIPSVEFVTIDSERFDDIISRIQTITPISNTTLDNQISEVLARLSFLTNGFTNHATLLVMQNNGFIGNMKVTPNELKRKTSKTLIDELNHKKTDKDVRNRNYEIVKYFDNVSGYIDSKFREGFKVFITLAKIYYLVMHNPHYLQILTEGKKHKEITYSDIDKLFAQSDYIVK